MYQRNGIRRRKVLVLGASAAAMPWSSATAQQSAGKPLQIVDSQIHIWGGGKPTPVQRQEPVTKDQIWQEMTAAGVSRAIIVPPTWDPAGNGTALEAAKAHPDRFAVMGLINLAKPAPDEIAAWKKQPGMLGVRLFLGTPQAAAALTDGTADWFWPAAEKADLAVMIQAAGQLPAVGRIAERHPRLRFAIDNLGAPIRTTNAAAFADLPNVLALAKLKNVSIKAEGVPSLSTEAYPYKNLHGYLRQIYDAFGPERMFWGSDITRMKATYKQCVTAFTEELPWLADRDRELIMGRAVANWIGWPLKS